MKFRGGNRAIVAVLACMATPSLATRPTEPRIVGNASDLFGPDAYPAAAIAAQEEGRVAALLRIDVRGAVTDCAIDQTSGSSALDTTTCAIARKIRFAPARNAKRRAIAGTYNLSVRWVLPDGTQTLDLTDGRHALTDVTFEYAVDATGVAQGCKVIEEPTHGGGACERFVPGTMHFPIPIVNGEPAAATVTVKTLSYMDAK